MSRVSGGQKLVFKTWSTQYLIPSGWDVYSLQQDNPTLCFWYPFMNLDLVVRGPISGNGWYFFCLKALSQIRFCLVFRASIHQIVEKKKN